MEKLLFFLQVTVLVSTVTGQLTNSSLIPQKASESYSKVRFTSTRRNSSDYDSYYSLLTNPALANHRLPVYPRPTTNSYVLPPTSTPSATPPSMEVQSAIHDAINQAHGPYLVPNDLRHHSDTIHGGELQHVEETILHEVTVAPGSRTTQEPEIGIKDYHGIDNDNRRIDTPTVKTTTTRKASTTTKKTTTECFDCLLLEEEFRRNQEKIKTLNKVSPLPMMNGVLPVVTKAPEVVMKVDDVRRNFTAPVTNEVFSINDAMIHPKTSQPLPQFTPMSNGFPQEVVTNPPPVLPPLPPGMVILRGPQNPMSLPPGVMPHEALSLPSGVLNGQDPMHLPQGVFLMDPNRMPNQPPQQVLMQHQKHENQQQLFLQKQHFAQEKLSQGQPMQPNLQIFNPAQNAEQERVHGPMGIPIPIPPKTVPGHRVMAPPVGVGLPQIAPQNPSPQNPPPPRRSGGFLNGLRNFFSGSMFGNRYKARFLDDDSAPLIEESINGTFSNQTDDVYQESSVIEYENTNRTKRSAEDKKNITLLDEVTDYLKGAIQRFQNDAQKYTIWPTLRNIIRTLFYPSDRQETQDGKRSKAGKKKNFWSVFLEEGVDRKESKRRNLEDEVHKVLTTPEKSIAFEELKMATETSLIPRCAIDTRIDYCLKDLEYPDDLVRSAVNHENTNLSCNVTLGQFHIHRLSGIKSGVCKSPIQKSQPLRAKNQEGIWKLIVNIDSCRQTVLLQKCHPLCHKSANTVDSGHCKEVHAPYNLMAFDGDNGFHKDTFYFPSACWCGS